jgi:hypothetical protein
MYSHYVFLCLLPVLVIYPMVYSREYPFTLLQRTPAITDPPSPPSVRYNENLLFFFINLNVTDIY